MKKHKAFLCCLILILGGGCARSSDNPEIKDTRNKSRSDDMAELLPKVRSTLPHEWSATISQKNNRLIVAYKTAASVEYRTEGSSEVRKRADERIQISLVRVPFITVDEYLNKKNNNQLGRQKRMEFEEKRLSHLFADVLKNHKISRHPFPPEMYDPRSVEDKQAVSDYTDLWQDTEPAELPTHRFKSASFTIKHYPIINPGGPHIYIGDEHISAQHDEILVSIKGILSKY